MERSIVDTGFRTSSLWPIGHDVGSYPRQSINDRALWISAAALGGGTAGRPRVGRNAAVEPPLPRRRLPAADRHVATRQRQEARQLPRYRQPRAHAGSEDTLERLVGVRPGAGGSRRLLPVRGHERHRRWTQQSRLSHRERYVHVLWLSTQISLVSA